MPSRKEHDIDQKQKYPRFGGDNPNPFGQLHGHLFHGQQPGQASRGADDQHDRGAGLKGLEQQGRNILPGDIAVYINGNDQPIDNGDGRRFGGGEDAGPDAADDDYRHEQGARCGPKGGPDLLHARHPTAGVTSGFPAIPHAHAP